MHRVIVAGSPFSHIYIELTVEQVDFVPQRAGPTLITHIQSISFEVIEPAYFQPFFSDRVSQIIHPIDLTKEMCRARQPVPAQWTTPSSGNRPVDSVSALSNHIS
ncbi:hypothetical protein D3C80_1177580 [compost metagenome]